MRLVTWNIDGLTDAHLDERTEAAIFTSILGARLDELHGGTKPTPPPDVIVFQEVVKRTFQAHMLQHLPAGGYTVLPVAVPERQTFELIAFRDPYRLLAYESFPLEQSKYGRIMHVVDLDSPEGQVRVVTAHMDSGTEAGNIRTAQLFQVAEALGAADTADAIAPAIFGGDTNLRKAEWEAMRKEIGITDVWERLGELASTRYTWRRDDYKARFDRVFVGPGFTPVALGPLGTEPLPGLDGPISDHIGLVATVRRK